MFHIDMNITGDRSPGTFPVHEPVPLLEQETTCSIRHLSEYAEYCRASDTAGNAHDKG